ncbi:hypothetical protein JD844_012744 [Phrynosoma platyrhinos]|uniref:Uncharacterized protein n=1 Tax=Phrynosoma platyrhinos TaxID=52577 RepID=A0ABQ7TKQ6_PHRPL|nr:hypothetical protein JD844_012744 [Phrynosoma platyrhinos]
MPMARRFLQRLLQTRLTGPPFQPGSLKAALYEQALRPLSIPGAAGDVEGKDNSSLKSSPKKKPHKSVHGSEKIAKKAHSKHSHSPEPHKDKKASKRHHSMQKDGRDSRDPLPKRPHAMGPRKDPVPELRTISSLGEVPISNPGTIHIDPGTSILCGYTCDDHRASITTILSSETYPRGIQLSALFMSGVDMALFANDACGQPIPWEHCCPWMYFDGKLFQTKLIKASREKAEQAAKVEKMRQSILEGLNFSRQNHPLPFPPPPAMPFYPTSVYPRHFGPVPPPQGRGRGFAGVYGFGGPYGETVATNAYRAFRVAAAGGHSGGFSGNDSNRTSKFQGGVQPIPSQGGKLEIAGTVVGHWAGSRRGRGGRGPFPLQGKPPYAASAEEVAKELKSKSEESKSSIVSSEGSLAENGVVNEEKPVSQMNGNTADVRASNQSESALSNDSKPCNTNPHLNALNADSVCHKDDALEATVLKKEE